MSPLQYNPASQEYFGMEQRAAWLQNSTCCKHSDSFPCGMAPGCPFLIGKNNNNNNQTSTRPQSSFAPMLWGTALSGHTQIPHPSPKVPGKWQGWAPGGDPAPAGRPMGSSCPRPGWVGILFWPCVIKYPLKEQEINPTMFQKKKNKKKSALEIQQSTTLWLNWLVARFWGIISFSLLI